MTVQQWFYSENSMMRASRMLPYDPAEDGVISDSGKDEDIPATSSDGDPVGPFVLVADLGFTREMYNAIDDVFGNCRGGEEWEQRFRLAAEALERIAALLPPEPTP